MSGDPWACFVCDGKFPIQQLARDCEARHERETAPMTEPDMCQSCDRPINPQTGECGCSD